VSDGVTIFDNVDISANTQSGQSRSPQNLNFIPQQWQTNNGSVQLNSFAAERSIP
jgi:hypothetical protein